MIAFTILLLHMNGILVRLTKKVSSRSGSSCACSRNAGRNNSLKIAILMFFFQQGLCYHCASSLTIRETLNNGLQFLRSSGFCSSTRSILTLRKESAQCSMYISVRQTCNLWLGQCYLTSRMSLTYEARLGMSCDHSAAQYRKDGTTFNPLWSVGSMLKE